MAGGAFEDTEAAKRAHLYEYKITGYFIFSCIVAASGGALFGYDLGVSGGFLFLFLFFIYSFLLLQLWSLALLFDLGFFRYVLC